MLDGLSTLQLVHTAISLVAIVAGIPVILGLLGNRRAPAWSAAFWLFTALTLITGFMVFTGFTPAFFVGIVASVSCIAGIYALYARRARGPWRWIYVFNAVFSCYLNWFVLVVQSFGKIPPLHTLAPTGSEPPFAILQGVVLVAFVVIGLLSLRRFR